MCATDSIRSETPAVTPEQLIVAAARAALVQGLHEAVEHWADTLTTEVLLAQARALHGSPRLVGLPGSGGPAYPKTPGDQSSGTSNSYT